MTTSTHTIRRLAAMLGLMGVALAIAAPAALAGHQDFGTKAALRRAHAPQETPDLIERYLRNHPTQHRLGNQAGTQRFGEQTMGVDVSDALSRYVRNNPAPNRPAAPEATRPASYVPVADQRAFDWRDAGIGAGSALALMIALGSLLIVLRRKPSGTRMLSS